MKHSLSFTMLLLKLKFGQDINLQIGNHEVRITRAVNNTMIQLTLHELDEICTSMIQYLYSCDDEISRALFNIKY